MKSTKHVTKLWMASLFLKALSFFILFSHPDWIYCPLHAWASISLLWFRSFSEQVVHHEAMTSVALPSTAERRAWQWMERQEGHILNKLLV